MDDVEKEKILREAFPLIEGETKGFTMGMLRKRINEDLSDWPDDALVLGEDFNKITCAYGTLILTEDGVHKDAIKLRRRNEGVKAFIIG